jgi:NitT/TauT family transport system permease protein
MVYEMKRVPRFWISFATIVVVFAVWSIVSNTGMVGPSYLPSPQALLASFVQLLKNGYQRVPLWEHVGISLFRALTGFSLGGAV